MMIHHEGTKGTKAEALRVSHAVVGAAIEVHRHLGPGLLESNARMDLVVQRLVVVEVKAVERTAPRHHAQLLTYLKLTSLSVGLLINLNTELLRHGIRRMLNG